MRMIGRILITTAMAAGLAACGSAKDEAPAAGDSEAATAAEAPAAPAAEATTAAADGKPSTFAQCAVCHSIEPGKNGIGPSLAGAFGRKAGAEAGYTYSAALKDSGLTWDDATLDQWLAAPMKMVPGTKMTFAGMSDAAKRQEMIAYLKTLK